MLNIYVGHGIGYLFLCKKSGMFLSSIDFQVQHVFKGCPA